MNTIIIRLLSIVSKCPFRPPDKSHFPCLSQNKDALRENALLADSPIAARLATMDLALARPTLSVVEGSLLGGGGGWIMDRPWSFRGNVEYCRTLATADSLPVTCITSCGVTVTTVRATRSPDFRMRVTTFSWLA